MFDIIPFSYENKQLRVIKKDGELWWAANDVCEILQIVNPRHAMQRLDEDEKDVVLNDTPGGKQSMLCVNEPGLYTLVLASRKPEAKAFKRWITHDVIPSIRKTGSYSIQQPPVQGGGDIVSVIADANKLDQCIDHLQALKHLLYPEYIQEQLPPTTQTKHDIMRVFERTQQPLTVAQLKSRYLKNCDVALIRQACEDLVVTGQLAKEITAHAVNGRYHLV